MFKRFGKCMSAVTMLSLFMAAPAFAQVDIGGGEGIFNEIAALVGEILGFITGPVLLAMVVGLVIIALALWIASARFEHLAIIFRALGGLAVLAAIVIWMVGMHAAVKAALPDLAGG